MPRLAELAAAAHIGDGIDAAVIEPQPQHRRKVGRHAETVAAVAVEQRRVAAVARRILARNDGHRHPGAVLRHRVFAADKRVLHIERIAAVEAGARELVGRRVVEIDGARSDVAHAAHQNVVAIEPYDNFRVGHGLRGQLAHGQAAEAEHAHARRATRPVRHVKA